MKELPIRKLNPIWAALMNLSVRPRAIENEGKAVNAINEPYAFPQQTKVNIISNVNILDPHRDVYVEANKALINELAPNGSAKTIDDDPALSARYRHKHEELLDAKVKLKGLTFINWADLEVAKVDPITIKQLSFLVRGMPKTDDKDLIPDDEVPAVAAPAVVPAPEAVKA